MFVFWVCSLCRSSPENWQLFRYKNQAPRNGNSFAQNVRSRVYGNRWGDKLVVIGRRRIYFTLMWICFFTHTVKFPFSKTERNLIHSAVKRTEWEKYSFSLIWRSLISLIFFWQYLLLQTWRKSPNLCDWYFQLAVIFNGLEFIIITNHGFRWFPFMS